MRTQLYTMLRWELRLPTTITMGVVAVYTFSILNAEADFNVNVTFDPDEVFGVDDNYDEVFYEMQLINECPQYVPIDTTALDALAAEIMGLPATYEELQGDQLDKMLSLYESVHALEGRSEAYFTETYADAITKIDGLYADHQWALVKAELDALGARVEALPDYADMTDEQVQEAGPAHRNRSTGRPGEGVCGNYIRRCAGTSGSFLRGNDA